MKKYFLLPLILLQRSMRQLADPPFVSKMTANGDDPYPKSPEEFSQFVAKETTKWGAIARKANVQLE